MAMKVWMFLLAMTLPDVSPKAINDTFTAEPEEANEPAPPTEGLYSSNTFIYPPKYPSNPSSCSVLLTP